MPTDTLITNPPSPPIEDREGAETMTFDEYLAWWQQRVLAPTLEATEAGEC
jgi:hypothetical protein